jgi:hypothetical protein
MCGTSSGIRAPSMLAKSALSSFIRVFIRASGAGRQAGTIEISVPSGRPNVYILQFLAGDNPSASFSVDLRPPHQFDGVDVGKDADFQHLGALRCQHT